MKKILILSLFVSYVLISCDKSDPLPLDSCGNDVIIDENIFNARNSLDSLLFLELTSITGHCLNIKVGYSGCNDGHEIAVVTNGYVAESLPPQLQLRLVDKTVGQFCLAAFIDSLVFDLSILDNALMNEESVRLIFSDQDKEILWERD